MKFGPTERHERHEYPAGLGYIADDHGRSRGPSLVDNRPLYGPHHVPENEYQALMEADFGQDPVMSADEREADWLVFQEKIDLAGLTDMERVVVDCVVFGDMSLSQAGEYLARHRSRNQAYSKARVFALRNSAFEKLRKVFLDETLD